MGYAFFICSCDQFLSNLEWLHILIFFSSLFVGVGIGFALLAHPSWVILCKKSSTTYRRLFLFCFTCLQVNKFPVSLFLADKKGAGINYKSSLCKAVEPFKSYCSRIYRRQS